MAHHLKMMRLLYLQPLKRPDHDHPWSQPSGAGRPRSNNSRHDTRKTKHLGIDKCECRGCTTIIGFFHCIVSVSQQKQQSLEDQSSCRFSHFNTLRMGSVVNEYFRHAPRVGKKGKHSVSTKLLSNLQLANLR